MKLGRDAILTWIMAVRTRVIDELLLSLLKEGVDTVLNLGAGLDARPYRLDLPPGLRWIEIDHPHILKLKEDRLIGETPRCRLERIGVDLSNDAARSEVFARIGRESRKVLVLTEGVLPYLSVEQVTALATGLRAEPSIRLWIADYFSDEAMRYMGKVRRSTLKNAPFVFNPPSWEPFFKNLGWRLREIRYLGIEGEKWGRPFPLPRIARILMRLATRLGRMKDNPVLKSNGYAVLEP